MGFQDLVRPGEHVFLREENPSFFARKDHEVSALCADRAAEPNQRGTGPCGPCFPQLQPPKSVAPKKRRARREAGCAINMGSWRWCRRPRETSTLIDAGGFTMLRIQGIQVVKCSDSILREKRLTNVLSLPACTSCHSTASLSRSSAWLCNILKQKTQRVTLSF